jgi:predicted SAM-dependent methyltransferase
MPLAENRSATFLALIAVPGGRTRIGRVSPRRASWHERERMDRRDTIRSLFNGSGRILEIGPSHQPVFAKRSGYDVETIDHASAEELRKKYAEHNVNLDEIEEVDYVSDGGPLHEVIPHRERYDLIFSSHVIEHTTDLLGYFKSCELLLKPGGVIGLAIPDKRYMFDIFQPVSTTGRVLEAHYRKQVRHSPGAVYDFIANVGRLNEMDSWSHATVGSVKLISEAVASAKAMFDHATLEGGNYYDVHGWVFTPGSFRLILHDLTTLGLTVLREQRLVEVGALEFYVAMSVGGADHGLSRNEMQKALLREQVASGLQMLAAEDPRMAAARDLLAQPATVAPQPAPVS